MTSPVPYYERDGLKLYLGESLAILGALPVDLGVGAVVTDPPYSSGGAMRSDRLTSTTAKYVRGDTAAVRHNFSGDNRDQRGYLAWSALWLNAARRLALPGAALAVFTDWRQLPVTTDAVQAGGWVWRGIAVWDKTEAARPQRGAPRAQCEYVAWGSNGPMNPEANPVVLPGVARCSAVRDRQHIAQKPLSVMEWLCRLAPPGALILDPFAGSGTTLLAAAALGQTAIGIEEDEATAERAAHRLAAAQESLVLSGRPTETL